MSNQLEERELGWDDQIEKESEFILLPEGEYEFMVTSFERGRHNGSEKLPPCPKAVVYLTIKSDKGTTTIKHNLFLHTITESMLSDFFVGIGHKKKGQALKMDWSKVSGAKGRAKVGVKMYNDKQYNEIKSFIQPSETTYTAGNF